MSDKENIEDNEEEIEEIESEDTDGSSSEEEFFFQEQEQEQEQEEQISSSDEEEIDLSEICNDEDEEEEEEEEEDEEEEEVFIRKPTKKASKKQAKKKPSRRHGEYVINLQSKPIIIVGLGRYEERSGSCVIKLGIVGADDYGSGIASISEVDDDELDRCLSYQTFLKNGVIQEISSEQKEAIMQRVNAYRDMLRQQGYNIGDAYETMQVQEMLSPTYNIMKRKANMQHSDINRQKESIISFDLGRNQMIDPNDTMKVDGVSFSYETMSQFFRNK